MASTKSDALGDAGVSGSSFALEDVTQRGSASARRSSTSESAGANRNR